MSFAELSAWPQVKPVARWLETTNGTRALLYLAAAVIGVLSVYDAWLVYLYREGIDEENRFCRWLISLEPEHVSVFLAGKLLGTTGVVSILVLLTRYWQRVAVPTVSCVLLFQFGLMGYLHAYDSRTTYAVQVAQVDGVDPVDRWLAHQRELDAERRAIRQAERAQRILQKPPGNIRPRAAGSGKRRGPGSPMARSVNDRRERGLRHWEQARIPEHAMGAE